MNNNYWFNDEALLKKDKDTLIVYNIDALYEASLYARNPAVKLLFAGVKVLKLNFTTSCGMKHLKCALAIEQLKNIKHIDVCEENKEFVSVDGIVYSKNGKYLVSCHEEKKELLL